METWTAVEKDEEHITFEIKDGEIVRRQCIQIRALPMMFALGGYTPQMGAILTMQDLPWSFRKGANGNIYLDEKSLGL